MKKPPLLLPGALSVSVFLLSACGSWLQTPYQLPATATPTQWQYAAGENTLPADQWWRHFGDPQLNRLIDEALRRNNNLAIATIKVRRAQLKAGLDADKLLPSLAANASTGYDRRLRDQSSSRSNTAGVSVSYELDLWGRLGNQSDASQWEAMATEQDRESTALALIGTTANLYWEAAFRNRRIALSEQSMAYAEKTLALIRVQHQAGALSSLEVLEAEQNLMEQQAAHTQLLQQQVETGNALSILFDGPPAAMAIAPQGLPQQALPALQAGLPAQLLGRRPDLRAAELRLRQSLAGVDALRASYYPSLTLTSGVNGSSDALRDVLRNPVATLGAKLVLPFLQWNQMQLSVKEKQAEYEAAVIDFRQTLYKAFSDVENALSARQQYARQADLLEQNMQAAEALERLYELRYKSGHVALKFWLEAQEKRRSAEIALEQNRLDRLKNQVALYQALGGDARQTSRH